MRLSRRVCATATAAALLMLAAACGSSSGQSDNAASSAPKLTIMVAGITKLNQLPSAVVLNLGLLKKQGLDATVESTPAGVDAETTLVAGEVQAVSGFYAHTIDLAAQNKYIECVVVTNLAPQIVYLVGKSSEGSITSLAGFAGKTFGVSSRGSASDFLSNYLFESAGVNYSSVHVTQAGNLDTFLSAVEHNQIAGGAVTDPVATQLLSTGQAKTILDLRSVAATNKAFGGPYPSDCMYMDRSYVQSNSAVVQKVVNAYVEALKWMSTHTAAQIVAVLPASYYQGISKASYTAMVQANLSSFSTDGLMPG